ncbi:hypothetical protein [Streptomyces qinglanensis]|uniref:hypothetical protein n=1 Tax=Streptomyces qinglanensis TaxID=943816 RepID=UPI003D74F001
MTTTPPPGGWPMSLTELGQRYGVHYTAVSRALSAARRAHEADPTNRPAPPQPVNPEAKHLRYLPAEMDPWWAARPRRGRPPRAHRCATEKVERPTE